MDYFSTFTGISGFELGMNDAYANFAAVKRLQQGRSAEARISADDGQERVGTQQPRCVGICEIDRWASAITRFHFDHKNYGDITAVPADILSDFDFFVGGFPCQAFSIAGKRAGFDDVRGTLFFEIARILKHKRPGHFLLENVKGLLSHDGGKTYARILEVLADLGYFVETIVLNSKNYGVPQNRERIFFIGHLADECEREILSFGCGYESDYPQLSVGNDIAYALDAGYSKGGNDLSKARRTVIDSASGSRLTEKNLQQIGFVNDNAEANRIYDSSGIARTIKNGGGRGAKTGLYAVDTKNVGKPRFTDNVPTIGANSFKEPCKVSDGQNIRRLTPNECERLQGFPDDWTKYGTFENGETLEISDSQRYKTCGNAVTTNVIRAIILQMLEAGCLN